jgi:hypothetical protein
MPRESVSCISRPSDDILASAALFGSEPDSHDWLLFGFLNLPSDANLKEAMKCTILAVAVFMAIAGTALAQTKGSGATTSPLSSTMPRNSPSAALGFNSSARSSSPSVQDPSKGATGAVSPDQSGSATEPSTGMPVATI